MNRERGEGERSEPRDIDFSSKDESPISREPLDPNYNKPGDDFGPPRFTPQTSEFTLLDDNYYGFFMWRGSNGVLYLR